MINENNLKLFFSNLNKDKNPNGQNLAAVLKILIAHESEPGGPYYNEHGRIDPELNYEIARFLQTQNVQLKNLNTFLQTCGINAPNKNSIKTKTKNKIKNHITNTIIKKAKNRLKLLDKNLRNLGLKLLKETINNDQDQQIVLLSYFFKLALGKNGRNLPNKLIINLGLANLYLWLAYTTYDNIIDQAKQHPELAIANIAYREFILIILNIIKTDEKLLNFFREIMDDMETSNYNEASQNNWPNHYNYKNYESLSEKSLPHFLGPIIILKQINLNLDSSEFKNLLNFFKSYLIARQLNDDAHDWEDDLNNGYSNSVTALILKKYSKEIKINAKDNIVWIKEIFWAKEIIEINKIILNHIKIARENLKSEAIIEKPKYLKKFLRPLAKAAYKTFTTYKQTSELILAYKN